MTLPPGIVRLLYRCTIPLRRHRLRNRKVSLVSNDCWSSFMYRYYDIPFNSPFVGLFIMPDDYLALLSDPSVLGAPIQMKKSTESRHYASLSFFPEYPLGLLPGGIEIHFLHYKTADEAREKWTRRVKRMDWNNCIVKFSYSYGCTDEDMRKFDALPYNHKVSFAPHHIPDVNSLVVLKEFPAGEQLWHYWKVADFHYDLGRHADAIMTE